MLKRARAEGELEVAVLRQNIESLKVHLQKARQPLDAVRELEAQVRVMEQETEAPVERRSADPVPSSNTSFALGQRVYVRELNSEGIITALAETDAEVQIGSLRVRAKLQDLEHRPSTIMATSGGPARVGSSAESVASRARVPPRAEPLHPAWK